MLIQYCLNFFQLPYWDVLGRPGFLNTDIAVWLAFSQAAVWLQMSSVWWWRWYGSAWGGVSLPSTIGKSWKASRAPCHQLCVVQTSSRVWIMQGCTLAWVAFFLYSEWMQVDWCFLDVLKPPSNYTYSVFGHSYHLVSISSTDPERNMDIWKPKPSMSKRRNFPTSSMDGISRSNMAGWCPSYLGSFKILPGRLKPENHGR